MANEISPLGWALRRLPMKSQEETEATKSTQNNGKGLLLFAGNNQLERGVKEPKISHIVAIVHLFGLSEMDFTSFR